MRPGTTSSASSSSSHGTPAGTGVAAVRARSGSAPAVLAVGGLPVAGSTGVGRSGAGPSQPQASAANGGAPVGTSGAGGGARADGDDVSALPLEQQAVHYAQAGAAASAASDAVKAAMAFHLLNGCFMRVRGGYEGAASLAATAASAAPDLPGALVEAVSEGAPQSLVAYNTLSYLALAPEVGRQLLSSGLMAVLVGQLRAAATASLEQQLLVSGLGLLVTMTRVSSEARARLAGMRGVAGALAAALGHGAPAVRAPALQLVQELVLTGKGLHQVLNCSTLLAALDGLCEGDPPPPAETSDPGSAEQPTRGSQPQSQSQLQRQARSARATIRALAVVMRR